MSAFRSFGCSLILAFSVTAGTWATELPSASPEDLGFSSERLARIGPAIKGEIEKGQYPGAVILVARKGKLVYFDSFGQLDPANGKPMTNDAIFRLYSMTKPYTSVAVMMLMEEGRLRLTDPVSKYIPAFARLEVSVASTDPLPEWRNISTFRSIAKSPFRICSGTHRGSCMGRTPRIPGSRSFTQRKASTGRT